jgi:hypothetical protein
LGNILDPIPTWALMLGAALIVFGANELGFRFGRGNGPGLGAQDPAAVVQGAAFTVLALLLGFSFALALGRYDARRGALMRESNAVATTWLRSQLLDPPVAREVGSDLRIYLAARIAFAQADADPDQRLAADQTSSAVQRELWQVALQSARRDPHSTIVPLFIAALNDAINLSTEERAVLSTHIPDVVMIGILLIAFIASAMMGYGFGRQGQRALIFKACFALMLAIAFGLVLDLDRPQRGLIRVSLAPLQAVQHLMGPTAAQSAAP